MKRTYYNGHGFWKEDPTYKRIEYPINDEIIHQAEDVLNIKFPQSLIDLMKIQNGGELNYPSFALPSVETDEGRVRLPSIVPIHFEQDDISILSSAELLKEVDGLSKEFLVLWTDFHFWVVLDYRDKKDNPPVLYIVEDFLASKWIYFKVANTFEEFLHKLFR